MILAVLGGHREGLQIDTLIIGLTDENLRRLREGIPVHIDGRSIDQPRRDIVVMTGRDEAAIEKDIRGSARASGVAVTGSINLDSQKRDHLYEMVKAGADRLGLGLTWPATTNAAGFIPCADCGEAIQHDAESRWLHATDPFEHHCRYGRGCAHPLIYTVVAQPPSNVSPTNQQEGSTPHDHD